MKYLVRKMEIDGRVAWLTDCRRPVSDNYQSLLMMTLQNLIVRNLCLYVAANIESPKYNNDTLNVYQT
jgi:hypothetical protein